MDMYVVRELWRSHLIALTNVFMAFLLTFEVWISLRYFFHFKFKFLA